MKHTYIYYMRMDFPDRFNMKVVQLDPSSMCVQSKCDNVDQGQCETVFHTADRKLFHTAYRNRKEKFKEIQTIGKSS